MIPKTAKYDTLITTSLGIIYITINAIIILTGNSFYFSLIPIVMLIGIATILAYDKVFFLIIFLTPLSITLNYIFPKMEVNMSLLTEPFLIILLIIITFKFIFNPIINKKIIKHPITIALIFYLLWTLFAAVTSSMPVVSVKFFMSKIWLTIPVFFLGITMFKKDKNIKTFIYAYAIGLFIVVLYSTIKLSQISLLAKNAAHFVVKPFYNDHTAYGAILGLFAPVTWGLFFANKNRKILKIATLSIAILFTIGIVLSYSRATWIGAIAAIGTLILVKLNIKFKYVIITTTIIAITIATFWFQIIDQLEKNNQDSSSDLKQHIISMTNISTDASNVERLNRWYAAWQMFKEKPITGWGPGTYQFQYAPFQLERMKTIISTNFGNVGNAHSEYIGPLAEQGAIGTLTFIALAITILTTGFKTAKTAKNKQLKIISLSITLGFITYFIHGFLNNFLDTDKLAIPFFGFASILLAIDIYHTKKTIPPINKKHTINRQQPVDL